MIRLVARIVDQSDGAFQQTLLIQKMLVNIHSLNRSTIFFLSSIVVFRFPYQQPMNGISQQGRSDFAFDLRPFLQRTFYRQSPSSAQHTLLNAYLGCLWSEFSRTPVFSLSKSPSFESHRRYCARLMFSCQLQRQHHSRMRCQAPSHLKAPFRRSVLIGP
jgi:hypothetical protein